MFRNKKEEKIFLKHMYNFLTQLVSDYEKGFKLNEKQYVKGDDGKEYIFYEKDKDGNCYYLTKDEYEDLIKDINNMKDKKKAKSLLYSILEQCAVQYLLL